MRTFLLICSFVLLCACTAEPGSEKWCEQMSEKPKGEWSANDAGTYTMNCLVDGMAIGSDEWCGKMKAKPKGEWTNDESKSYAKHCVL